VKLQGKGKRKRDRVVLLSRKALFPQQLANCYWLIDAFVRCSRASDERLDTPRVSLSWRDWRFKGV
jgi:hypothetical protein